MTMNESMIKPKESFVIETKHKDIIHDVQFDYFSSRLATCSSDKTIRIFNIDKTGRQELFQVISGHSGPVWKVSWAPGKYGSIMASCSYDGKVCIWKEKDNQYSLIKEHMEHAASVNYVEWAPDGVGLILACASSDGKVSILEYNNENWNVSVINAHSLGCNSISWIMDNNIESKESLLLASGGCDHLVKFWKYSESEWKEYGTPLVGHTDWIRDVTWAPQLESSIKVLASCSQDRHVFIWSIRENRDKDTEKLSRHVSHVSLSGEQPFPEIVWRLAWSPMGLVLAVAYGDNNISIWKENLQGKWSCIKK